MRVLAIDLGTKNIGVALSDELGLTVRPVETIRPRNIEQAIKRLEALVHELEPERVVVGVPFRKDGAVGDAARRALKFVKRLQDRLDIPVVTQDERLTSYEAEQTMIERGLSSKERRARSDQFAAMIILRDYLSAAEVKK
jgi:putative Holliday junction resolvase